MLRINFRTFRTNMRDYGSNSNLNSKLIEKLKSPEQLFFRAIRIVKQSEWTKLSGV